MSTNLTIQMTRRQLLLCGAALVPLSACEAKPMTQITVDISVVDYFKRPIFDVFVNGRDFGGGAGVNGLNSIELGASVKLGHQKVTWRLGGPEGMARNGETVNAKNIPVLNAADIPKGVKWLALHIYPDDTVEFTFSKGTPGEHTTERGLIAIKNLEARDGK